ncbi:hypothetical protein [Bacillus andreraoultii]|nr:hypothetical protein [Bacillus andreraoultii]
MEFGAIYPNGIKAFQRKMANIIEHQQLNGHVRDKGRASCY